jgi:hypothetical protein
VTAAGNTVRWYSPSNASPPRCSSLAGVGGTLPSFDPLSIWRRWTYDVEGNGLDCGHFIPEEHPGEGAARAGG